jgi:hypothetical protein
MTSSAVTQDRMELALDDLANTDEEIAQLKTNVKRAEYVLKRREAHAFLSCEGAVKERESAAKVDTDVIAAYDAHTDAMEEYERLAAKRETWALIIEAWRTVEASRRRG